MVGFDPATIATSSAVTPRLVWGALMSVVLAIMAVLLLRRLYGLIWREDRKAPIRQVLAFSVALFFSFLCFALAAVGIWNLWTALFRK